MWVEAHWEWKAQVSDAAKSAILFFIVMPGGGSVIGAGRGYPERMEFCCEFNGRGKFTS